MSKIQGRVKWFNDAKGYGFVEATGIDKDVFVHYSAVGGEGYKSLREGEEIEFDLEQGAKGPIAVNVVRKTAKKDHTETKPSETAVAEEASE